MRISNFLKKICDEFNEIQNLLFCTKNVLHFLIVLCITVFIMRIIGIEHIDNEVTDRVLVFTGSLLTLKTAEELRRKK